MTWRILTATLLTGASLVGLAACAGGGGGGYLAPPTPVAQAPVPPAPAPAPPEPSPAMATAFTRWSDVAAPSRTVMVGIGQQVSLLDPPSTQSQASGMFGPTQTSAPRFTIGLDGAGKLDSLRIESGGVAGQLDRSTGSSVAISCCVQLADGSPAGFYRGIAYDYDVGPLIAYADPNSVAWSYQTFGAWIASGEPASSNSYGAFSVGLRTPDGGLPTTGAATFSGKLYGEFFTNPRVDEIAASMTLSVDFAQRRASFSSTDWWSITHAIPGTAMSGVLIYANQQNALSGVLTTANGAFAGPTIAQFYGPNAEEVGGTFTLAPTSGTAQDRVIGGFGAKR